MLYKLTTSCGEILRVDSSIHAPYPNDHAISAYSTDIRSISLQAGMPQSITKGEAYMPMTACHGPLCMIIIDTLLTPLL